MGDVLASLKWESDAISRFDGVLHKHYLVTRVCLAKKICARVDFLASSQSPRHFLGHERCGIRSVSSYCFADGQQVSTIFSEKVQGFARRRCDGVMVISKFAIEEILL